MGHLVLTNIGKYTIGIRFLYYNVIFQPILFMKKLYDLIATAYHVLWVSL